MGLFDFSRRRQYRVQPAHDGQITAVIVRDGRSIDCVLKDVSAIGCGLWSQSSAVQDLGEGDLVGVRFALPDWGLEAEAEFVVARSERSQRGQELGLAVVDVLGFHSQLKGVWWRFFNRRRSARVECAGARGIGGRLLGAGVSTSIRIENLAEGGAGVATDHQQAGALLGQTGLRLSLELGAGSMPLRLVAGVVHVDQRQTDALLGLNFDAEQTPDFMPQAEVIGRWCSRRMNTRRFGSGSASA